MSVAGYIGKNVEELRLPREGTAYLGIEYELASHEVKREQSNGERETYQSVVDYDPVLRAHCRL